MRIIPTQGSGPPPQDEAPHRDYSVAMKPTTSDPNTTQRQPAKDTQHSRDPGNQPPRQPEAGESASARATEKAKRGEPLTAENKKERSPKQENL